MIEIKILFLFIYIVHIVFYHTNGLDSAFLKLLNNSNMQQYIVTILIMSTRFLLQNGLNLKTFNLNLINT